MNPGRFFMPNMGFMNGPRIVYPITGGNMLRPSNTSAITRLLRGIRSFNWQGFLNGANKTVNVVNQTIPLIRNAKPMVDNVKSMLKLAKAFGNETNTKKYKYNSKNVAKNIHPIEKESIRNDDLPTFFI